MNLNLAQIRRMIRGGGSLHGLDRNPRAVWNILLIASVFLFFGVLGVVYTVNRGGVDAVSPVGSPVPKGGLNEERIKAAIQVYRDQDARLLGLSAAHDTIDSPSKVIGVPPAPVAENPVVVATTTADVPVPVVRATSTLRI